MNLRAGVIRIDDGAALRFPSGDIEKALPYSLVKFMVHAFVPVLCPPLPNPCQANLDGQIQYQSEIGRKALDDGPF